MDFKLVVVRPFGGYRVGAVVSDPKLMLAIQQGEHVDHVVRTAVPAPSIETPSVPVASVKES